MVTSTKDGTRLVTGTTPYSWLIQRQSGYTYTIRPAEKQSLMVNASGESNKNGTAIIVWAHSNKPKHCLFTFTFTAASVTVGKTLQLTASNQDVTWSSSNSAVAKVDGNGVVTGVKAGTATITVKTVDGGKPPP